MKKFLFALLMIFISASLLAQDQEDHSAEYNWGYKNSLYILIAAVVIIVVVIVWLVRRKRKP